MSKYEWTLEEILKATGGSLLYGESSSYKFSDISTDSRKIGENSVFIALMGERFDGHDFLEDALKRGARCLIVDKNIELSKLQASVSHSFSVVKVENTLKALGEIGRYRRSLFKGPVIGVTGSNGKTSTKEMISKVLEGKFRVLKNPMNWNNNIGLPLSIFQLEDTHEVAVLEMGINHPGEMDELVYIAQPTIGVITNIQKAHLEGLESEDKICAEKTKLWKGLPKDGLAVLNVDDERLVKAYQKICKTPSISFGIIKEADIRALPESIKLAREGTFYNVRYRGKTFSFRIPVLGEHFIYNSLSALAVSLHFGITLEDSSLALSQYKPVPHRMELHTLSDGTVIVDDAYNANPGSMLRAIETVSKVAQREAKPFIAILGDMRELGAESELLHREIGRELVKAKPAMVITLGEYGSYIADSARLGGIEMVFSGFSHEGVLEIMMEHWMPGAWILVKGSRAMAMEKIVEELLTDGET